MPKLVEPPGEARSDYAICAALAERLGFGQTYTQGRDERGWVAWLLGAYRRTRFPELPALDDLLETNAGVYANPVTQPAVAFADFRRDPERHRLDTPSGKIEIFSKALYDLNRPDEIPAVPKYIQEWESPFDAALERSQDSLVGRKVEPPAPQLAPLQLLGHHTLARVHSTHANNDWLQEAFPQRVFINPLDASARGLQDGDLARIYNARGEVRLPCRVTERILPGVVDIPQGAWQQLDASGVDVGGSVNTLTSARWTPLAFGSAQHTALAFVEKVV
jgi:anaerobic dimethyl sulfoxide reductase subunit A